MKETSRGMRQVMTVVAVLVGLFMIGAAPWLAQVSLDLVLENLGRAAQQKPALSSGLMLFDLFYPLLRALVFVAGTALLVISYPLLQGEEWAYGLSLLLLAIPAVSGMFMFLPYVSFVKDAAPLPLFITLGGLIGFWTVLLGKKGDGRDRVTRFFAFTFMGMSITHSLTTGVGCLRQLMTRPGHPLYGDVGWWVLSLCGQVLWVSALPDWVTPISPGEEVWLVPGGDRGGLNCPGERTDSVHSWLGPLGLRHRHRPCPGDSHHTPAPGIEGQAASARHHRHVR